MATFTCPDCGSDASTDQSTCPGCGGHVKRLARKVVTSSRNRARPLREKFQAVPQAEPQEETQAARPDSTRMVVWSGVGLLLLWFTVSAFQSSSPSDQTPKRDGYGPVNTSGMPTAPPAASRSASAVDNQFSAWDGSHRILTRKIKERLHDDKSYSHITTAHEIKDGKVYIMTSFRASNAMGTTIKNLVVAEAGAVGNGSDVTILSWN